MAKLTVLDMVQDIMSDMSSDEVNSIFDTPDSAQVAQILKSTFFEIIDSTDNWPHLRELMALDSSTDNTKPTHMALPENVKALELVKYDTRKVGETKAKYQDINYLYPDSFLTLVNSYNTDHDDVELITDYSGVKFPIKTSEAPTHWTSFDDQNLVFNAYDSEVDDTLQTTKSQCLATRNPGWSMQDDFVPDLPEEAFSRLLAEAKSASFLRLKQAADEKAEQQARRQRRSMARRSWRAKGGLRFPNYGRTPRK